MLREGYRWSGGEKLVDTLLDELRLREVKFMATPAIRYTAKQLEEAEELSPSDATYYRSSLGKLMYLATDHPDIEYAVNCLARRASSPTDGNVLRLRQVVRYLCAHREVFWQGGGDPGGDHCFRGSRLGRRCFDEAQHMWRTTCMG